MENRGALSANKQVMTWSHAELRSQMAKGEKEKEKEMEDTEVVDAAKIEIFARA